jgi:hypothetical protein
MILPMRLSYPCFMFILGAIGSTCLGYRIDNAMIGLWTWAYGIMMTVVPYIGVYLVIKKRPSDCCLFVGPIFAILAETLAPFFASSFLVSVLLIAGGTLTSVSIIKLSIATRIIH